MWTVAGVSMLTASALMLTGSAMLRRHPVAAAPQG
jgi:hypothetical protein